MKKQNKEFNLKEAREGLRYILMDKTIAGFGLDEDTTKAILHLVKTSDKEFIKRLKEWCNQTPKHSRKKDCPHCKTLYQIEEQIDKLAGSDLI